MTQAQQIKNMHQQMKQAGAAPHEYYKAATQAARSMKKQEGYDPTGGYKEGKFYYTLQDESKIVIDTYNLEVLN